MTKQAILKEVRKQKDDYRKQIRFGVMSKLKMTCPLSESARNAEMCVETNSFLQAFGIGT